MKTDYSRTNDDLISVVMPMYNASAYLRECIDSILAQTYENFELLIGDDGSTDDSVEIVRSYDDPRIRLLRYPHDYIATCNHLLEEAKGKYIARMDADDVMVNNRLEVQYKAMERHLDIGILGARASILGKDEIILSNCSNNLTFLSATDFLYSNPIINPTTMMRKSMIKVHLLHYNVNFCYAEDYHFWYLAITRGIRIAVIPFIGISYRNHQQQTTFRQTKLMDAKASLVQSCFSKWISKESNPDYKKPRITDCGHDLTIIIPFLNEGIEVVNTVKSVRESVGDKVDIIIINDQSTDGVNYKELTASFNVYYILNKKRMGVAASRDYGISLCKTRYFLLLDAHMRLYEGNWLNEFVEILNKNDRRILCAQTKQLWKNEEGEIVELDNSTVYGAYAKFFMDDSVPGIDWNYITTTSEDSAIEPIACILGAGYAGSKRYWMYLKGLKGLEQYGSDEVYISFKAWLEGGACLLMKKHSFGHIYREKSPYFNKSSSLIYNQLLVSYTLFPVYIWLWSKNTCRINNKTSFDKAFTLLKKKKRMVVSLKCYYQSIFTKTSEDVILMNLKMSFFNIYDREKRWKVSSIIYNKLIARHSHDFGIVGGETAKLLWLSIYKRKKRNSLRKKSTLLDVFSTIKSAVLSNQLPYNFQYGTCGIGWAMIYLYSQGLICNIDEEMLEAIDKNINTLNIACIEDNSFYKGLGGIIAYVVCREAYNELNGIDNIMSQQILLSLKKKAKLIVKAQEEVSSCYYADLILSNETWILGANFKPSLIHWVKFPLAIPQNSKYWRYTLDDGCLAYTIPSLL